MSTVNFVYKMKQAEYPFVNTICTSLFYSLQLLLAHSNNYTDLISSFHAPDLKSSSSWFKWHDLCISQDC